MKVVPMTPQLEQVLLERNYSKTFTRAVREVIKEVYKCKIDQECDVSVYNEHESDTVEIRLLKEITSDEKRKAIFIVIEMVINGHKFELDELTSEEVERLGGLLDI